MDLVVARKGNAYVADWGAGARPCAVGRGGVGEKRGEGDGVTPAGVWALRRVLYRADRLTLGDCAIPAAAIAPDDGWCDAPGDPRYNRPVRHPYPASAEHLWRADGLYDVVIVVGFNDDPVADGKGSAMFVHVAAPGFSATEGCVALARDDMPGFVAALRPGDMVRIVTP